MFRFALPLVFVLAVSVRAEDVVLRWRFDPGTRQAFRLTQSVDLDFALQIPGFDKKQKMSAVHLSEWSARSIRGDDTGGKVEIRMDRISFETTADGKTAKVDTDEKSDEASPLALLGKGIGKLLGKGFEVDLSPQGAVRGTEGLRRVVEDALKELGVPVDDQLLAKLDESMVAEVLCRQSWPRLPEGKTAVGASWKLPVAGTGLSALEAECTLKAIEQIDGKKAARVSVNIRADDKALAALRFVLPLKQLQGADLTVGLKKWESEGEFVILLDAGTLLRSKMDTRLELTVGTEVAGSTLGVEVKYDGRESVQSIAPR